MVIEIGLQECETWLLNLLNTEHILISLGFLHAGNNSENTYLLPNASEHAPYDTVEEVDVKFLAEVQ